MADKALDDAIAPNTPVDDSSFTTSSTTNNNDEFDSNRPIEVADQEKSSEPNPDEKSADDIDSLGGTVGLSNNQNQPLDTAKQIEEAERNR